MDTWFVSHGHTEDDADEFSVHLVRVPWWADALETLVDEVDAALGHHFCWVWATVANWVDGLTRELHCFAVAREEAVALGWRDPFEGCDDADAGDA